MEKRPVIKSLLIGSIVIAVIIMVYVVLPEVMDLENQTKMTYEGNPTYACTEPYVITSCMNKTALHGYVFSHSGMSVIDINYTFKP